MLESSVKKSNVEELNVEKLSIEELEELEQLKKIIIEVAIYINHVIKEQDGVFKTYEEALEYLKSITDKEPVLEILKRWLSNVMYKRTLQELCRIFSGAYNKLFCIGFSFGFPIIKNADKFISIKENNELKRKLEKLEAEAEEFEYQREKIENYYALGRFEIDPYLAEELLFSIKHNVQNKFTFNKDLIKSFEDEDRLLKERETVINFGSRTIELDEESSQTLEDKEILAQLKIEVAEVEKFSLDKLKKFLKDCYQRKATLPSDILESIIDKCDDKFDQDIIVMIFASFYRIKIGNKNNDKIVHFIKIDKPGILAKIFLKAQEDVKIYYDLFKDIVDSVVKTSRLGVLNNEDMKQILLKCMPTFKINTELFDKIYECSMLKYLESNLGLSNETMLLLLNQTDDNAINIKCNRPSGSGKLLYMFSALEKASGRTRGYVIKKINEAPTPELLKELFRCARDIYVFNYLDNVSLLINACEGKFDLDFVENLFKKLCKKDIIFDNNDKLLAFLNKCNGFKMSYDLIGKIIQSSESLGCEAIVRLFDFREEDICSPDNELIICLPGRDKFKISYDLMVKILQHSSNIPCQIVFSFVEDFLKKCENNEASFNNDLFNYILGSCAKETVTSEYLNKLVDILKKQKEVGEPIYLKSYNCQCIKEGTLNYILVSGLLECGFNFSEEIFEDYIYIFAEDLFKGNLFDKLTCSDENKNKFIKMYNGWKKKEEERKVASNNKKKEKTKNRKAGKPRNSKTKKKKNKETEKELNDTDYDGKEETNEEEGEKKEEELENEDLVNNESDDEGKEEQNEEEEKEEVKNEGLDNNKLENEEIVKQNKEEEEKQEQGAKLGNEDSENNESGVEGETEPNEEEKGKKEENTQEQKLVVKDEDSENNESSAEEEVKPNEEEEKKEEVKNEDSDNNKLEDEKIVKPNNEEEEKQEQGAELGNEDSENNESGDKGKVESNEKEEEQKNEEEEKEEELGNEDSENNESSVEGEIEPNEEEKRKKEENTQEQKLVVKDEDSENNESGDKEKVEPNEEEEKKKEEEEKKEKKLGNEDLGDNKSSVEEEVKPNEEEEKQENAQEKKSIAKDEDSENNESGDKEKVEPNEEAEKKKEEEEKKEKKLGNEDLGDNESNVEKEVEPNEEKENGNILKFFLFGLGITIGVIALILAIGFSIATFGLGVLAVSPVAAIAAIAATATIGLVFTFMFIIFMHKARLYDGEIKEKNIKQKYQKDHSVDIEKEKEEKIPPDIRFWLKVKEARKLRNKSSDEGKIPDKVDQENDR